MKHQPRERRLPASCLRVLAELLQTRQARKLPPTVQELADRLGLTSVPVHQALLRLREAGLVAWESHKARTLRAICSWEEVGHR